MPAPRTLQEAIIYFSDEDVCREFVAKMRWPDGVVCPRCGSLEVSWLENQKRWQCKSRHASRMFSVKVGTIFEDSPISLTKWLPAAWLIASAKNGISSHELARSMGVTQKSAWFMLQRLRLAICSATSMSRRTASTTARRRTPRGSPAWWRMSPVGG